MIEQLDIELLEILDPWPDHWKLVYEIITEPDNIGDVHLKTLIWKHEKYEIDLITI